MFFIKYILCVLFLLKILPSNAQSAFEDNFSREFTYGAGLTTNGGLPASISFKYGKVKTASTNTTLGIEIVGITHPKERKVSGKAPTGTGQTQGGRSFVFGKTNYLYSIRPQYGVENILFRKASREGVQVSSVFAFGPSIGIVRPYMLLYDVSPSASSPNLQEVAYDPEIHVENRIYGRGGFLAGFGKSSLAIGANVRAALSFEIGAFKNSITGLEAGFTLEAFTNKITIMDNLDHSIQNKNVFTSAYVTIYFGWRKE